jgi:outer membrane protein TolC
MHRPLFHRVALAAALILTTSAHAQTNAPLRLADVLETAAHANPQVQVARQRAAALRAVPAQVSAYDDPTLSWEGWDVPNSLRIDQAENNIFRLSQKIPFPGKRTLAGTVAEHGADAAEQEIRASSLDIAAAVTRAYYDLWLAHQQRAILTRDKQVVEQLARTTEGKYGIGEATQADALRAQVELTHMVIAVSTAGLAVQTAAAELNALLSQPPDEPLGVPEDPAMGPLTVSVETLTDLALQQRPELAAQRAAIAGDASGVELARLGWWPDFEFSFGRFVNYQQSDGFGAMASVTVPFVYGSKYTAATAEARAKLAGAEANLRGWQDRIRREVAQAYVRVQTAALQHSLARGTHIPQAEQALRVTESAYQAGSTDFASLLDTVRRIEEVHLQHVGAAAELGKATADLERAVGGALPPPIAARD